MIASWPDTERSVSSKTVFSNTQLVCTALTDGGVRVIQDKSDFEIDDRDWEKTVDILLTDLRLAGTEVNVVEIVSCGDEYCDAVMDIRPAGSGHRKPMTRPVR